MKDKILSALKSGIGKTSINDKTLNSYVNIIADKITDESQIGEAIKPYIEVLKEFQGNINSIASEAATAKETTVKARLGSFFLLNNHGVPEHLLEIVERHFLRQNLEF